MMWLLLGLLYLTTCGLAADQKAVINNLPGLPSKPTFRQYSGYLNASESSQLHYWFVESQNNPSTDPVVLWLNGGPGCSSLDGLLTENGPFLLQKNLTLKYNQYSWNKYANVLYLEAPAGVGFSYSTTNVSTDDDKVARENRNALIDFFNKFAEFKSNEFFITGESYGGIYIPTLTDLLLNVSSINLKGIAVGNGLSSYRYNDVSLVYFMYYHGLFDEALWNNLQTNCNCTGKIRCFFTDNKSQACQFSLYAAKQSLAGLNVYNLYGPCYHPQHVETGVIRYDLANLFRTNMFVARERALAKDVFTKNRHQNIRESPECVDATATKQYLNSASVRAALHIPASVQQWDICSSNVEDHYKRVYQEMSAQYRRILKTNTRVLIYNGDVDMACNFLGDEWFFDDMKYPVDYSSKQWYITNKSGQQVAGVSKSFANGQLVFTTIRGSGHMVPTDRPQSAYRMINTFLANQHL